MQEDNNGSLTFIRPISIRHLLSPMYKYKIYNYKILSWFEHSKAWLFRLFDDLQEGYELSFFRQNPFNNSTYKIKLTQSVPEVSNNSNLEHINSKCSKIEFESKELIVKYISHKVIFSKLIIKKENNRLKTYIIENWSQKMYILWPKWIRLLYLPDWEKGLFKKDLFVFKPKSMTESWDTMEVWICTTTNHLNEIVSELGSNPHIKKIKAIHYHIEFPMMNFNNSFTMIKKLSSDYEYKVKSNEFEFLKHVFAEFSSGKALILFEGKLLAIKFKQLSLWWKIWKDIITLPNGQIFFSNYAIKTADFIQKINEEDKEFENMKQQFQLLNRTNHGLKNWIIIHPDQISKYYREYSVNSLKRVNIFSNYSGMIHIINSLEIFDSKQALINHLNMLSKNLSKNIVATLEFKKNGKLIQYDDDAEIKDCLRNFKRIGIYESMLYQIDRYLKKFRSLAWNMFNLLI